MTKLEELIGVYRNTMPCVKLNRTIFFDESNNFRKGVIGAEKDNHEELESLYFTTLKHKGVTEAIAQSRLNIHSFGRRN